VAIEDPREVVEIYRRSAQLAKEAGFDGVELLAQGYPFLFVFSIGQNNCQLIPAGATCRNNSSIRKSAVRMILVSHVLLRWIAGVPISEQTRMVVR
jgi:hypothetical protein